MPQFIDHSDARSMTAQPTGSHPSASRVASLGVDLTLCRGTVNIFYSPTGWYYLEFQRFIYIYIYISGEMVDIVESGKVLKINETLFLSYTEIYTLLISCVYIMRIICIR